MPQHKIYCTKAKPRFKLELRRSCFYFAKAKNEENTEFYAKALPVAFHLVLCLDGTNHTVHTV